MNSSINGKASSVAAAIAAGFLAVCGQGAFAASDRGAAADQPRSAEFSPDVQGFGRDGDWKDGAWRATHALTAPELGSSLAASALGLLIGGLAVVRDRLRR